MTAVAYNRIKAALKAQRDKITSSPGEATQLINDLGIRDIVIEGVTKKKSAAKTTQKAETVGGKAIRKKPSIA